MVRKSPLSLLRDAYAAYLREGWEASKTLDEVMEEAAELLEEYGMKPAKEVVEEVP